MNDVIGALAPNSTRERIAGLGVHVVEGAARFTDEQTVMVGDVTIRARRFVIATGSSPVVPTIAGLQDTPHLTSETVFDLAEIPRHLIVVGAGVVGARTGAGVPPPRLRRHRARRRDAAGQR